MHSKIFLNVMQKSCSPYLNCDLYEIHIFLSSVLNICLSQRHNVENTSSYNKSNVYRKIDIFSCSGELHLKRLQQIF